MKKSTRKKKTKPDIKNIVTLCLLRILRDAIKGTKPKKRVVKKYKKRK